MTLARQLIAHSLDRNHSKGHCISFTFCCRWQVTQGWKILLKLCFHLLLKFLANGSDIRHWPQGESAGVVKPLHSPIHSGWLSQSTGRGENTRHRQPSVNFLSAQPAGSERQGMSPHLFPSYSAHIGALLCSQWAHAWTITSLPDTAAFLTWRKHGCQSCRAWPWGLQEGRKRQRHFGPRPPGEVLFLSAEEVCGWAGLASCPTPRSAFDSQSE